MGIGSKVEGMGNSMLIPNMKKKKKGKYQRVDRDTNLGRSSGRRRRGRQLRR